MFSMEWKKQNTKKTKPLNSVILKQVRSFPYDRSIAQGLVLLKLTPLSFFLSLTFSFLPNLNFAVTVPDFVLLNDERQTYYPRCFWWIMWRQAFPYTMAFLHEQMEIHPLPCFLTLLISCHHREELKSGFPPNWPKAWRCRAAFLFQLQYLTASTCCQPLTCWALVCWKQGSRISNSEKCNNRKIWGRGRVYPYWKDGWIELGLDTLRPFFLL